MIFNDPNFKGVGGAFDPARFQAVIRQFGFTEQRYVADQRRVSLRRQIAGTDLGRPGTAESADRSAQPFPERAAVDRVRQTRRRTGRNHRSAVAGDAGRLFRRSQDPVPRARISQDFLCRDYAGRDRQMVRGFRRGCQKDLRAAPRQTRDAGTAPGIADRVSERRRKPRRRAIASASGLSFEDLAKERGLNPSDVDLGMVAKSAIIDPAIADAAFSLPSGEVSQPVQGRFGVALVKIGKIEPGVEPSYESVASSLKKEIATGRARASRSPTCTTRWKTSAAAAPA